MDKGRDSSLDLLLMVCKPRRSSGSWPIRWAAVTPEEQCSDREGRHVAKIVELETHDVRFPTSRQLDGSDAMNPSPDYSAAYVVLRTERRARRATDLPSRSGGATTSRWRASERSPRWSSGRPWSELLDDLGAFSRRSPATASCVGSGPRRASSTWRPARSSTPRGTCAARRAGKPLWKLLADLTPGGARRRWSTSATCATRSPRRRRWRMLRAAEPGPGRARARSCCEQGYPAYTTTPGWLGYDDEKLRAAVAAGRRRRLHR